MFSCITNQSSILHVNDLVTLTTIATVQNPNLDRQLARIVSGNAG